MSKTPIEEKMVFGVAPDGQGDGVPLILLGIPKGAWEHMKDGKTHTFDMTRVGIPVKFMIYGAADHDAALQVIKDHMSGMGLPYLDARREDFAIKPKG